MDQDQRETRERILDSAALIFAESGFGGARIKDIAGRAGVTGAMVHYYFSTKNDLHAAVLGRMFSDLAAMVGRIAPDPIEPIPKLCLFFYSLFDYCNKHRTFARLTAMQAGKDKHDDFLSQVRVFLRPMYDDAVVFMEDGMDSGLFRRMDPHQVLTIIYGMIFSYFSDSPFMDAVMGREEGAREFVAGHREILMDMILRMLVKKPDEIDLNQLCTQVKDVINERNLKTAKEDSRE